MLHNDAKPIGLQLNPASPDAEDGTIKAKPAKTSANRKLLRTDSRQYAVNPEPIAKGSFGTLYAAIDEKEQKQVILKSIPENRQSVASVLQEANATKLSGSQFAPHKVYNVPRHLPWMPPAATVVVMPVAESDAQRAITALHKQPHAVRKSTYTYFLRTMAQRLNTQVHSRDWVHADLKPENILVDAHGDLYLHDFGLAVESGKESRFAFGTPYTMAPELHKPGPYRFTPAVDHYALGMTCVDCIVPKHLNALMAQSKRRDPQKPAKKMAADLADWHRLASSDASDEATRKHPLITKLFVALGKEAGEEVQHLVFCLLSDDAKLRGEAAQAAASLPQEQSSLQQAKDFFRAQHDLGDKFREALPSSEVKAPPAPPKLEDVMDLFDTKWHGGKP